MCGYARSVCENIICTPGLDLSSCSCFPLTVAAFIIEMDTQKRKTCLIHACQQNLIYSYSSMTFVLSIAMMTVTHTCRWFTDDGLWCKKLLESKHRRVSYQPFDPLISKACVSKGLSASLWQELLDVQVCASPKAGATLQASLSSLRARSQSGPWEHVWARDWYSPTCAFSLGYCSHHPVDVITARQHFCHCPEPLPHIKERNMGPGGCQKDQLWELSQGQHCWKGWKIRNTSVYTLLVLVAELRGILKPRSPHRPDQSAKGENCRDSNVWSAEQLVFLVVYHQLIACSGPV